jgi:hypothetical protein
MTRDTRLPAVTRRQLLAVLGVGGTAAGLAAYLGSDDGGPVETTETDADEAQVLAQTYAPTLYFGTREQWFPTDPRAYTSDRDGETVVDGFDALDGYTADAKEAGSPPNPIAFYHAVDYPNASLSCVQFWFYSAFDQFSTNFHWHDWEVLHVFVDRETGGDGTGTDAADTEANGSNASGSAAGNVDTGTPVLFVASAHSPKVPNNEFLDPEADRAAIISEVGSHSSTLGLNARPSTFQRTSIDGLAPDISNRPVEVLSGETPMPLAYGLPRDEGIRLPYAIPELDGAPLTDHERLPNVGPEDLLAADLTVESFAELAAPPTDIPARESATKFVPDPREEPADGDESVVTYALEDIEAVSDIDAFTGPQLSFTFSVPTFAEDLLGEHLTGPSAPWEQTRFTDPTGDITDPRHRQELAARYDPIPSDGGSGRLLGAVQQLVDAEDAPGSNGVGLVAPAAELVAVLESESAAVPTFGGVVVLQDPPTGDHRLTINGAGVAPYSETLTVGEGGDGGGDSGEDSTNGGTGTDDGTGTEGETENETGTPTGTQPTDAFLGVDGRISMAANEDAVKVRGKTRDGAALDRLTLDDDFGGRLFDGSTPGEDDRFGIYAHRSSAFTAEIRDTDGARGAVRLNPNADDDELLVEDLTTGKAALTDYLVRFLAETRAQTAVFENGTSEGIDDVPTGRDVTDEAVSKATEKAKANVADLVGDVGPPDGRGGGSGGSGNGNGNDDTATATPSGTTSETTDSDGSDDAADAADSAKSTETTTDTATATPTASATPTDTATTPESGDGPKGDFDPGTGFTGVLKSFDASLVAAVRAREAASNGSETSADKRLEIVRRRLLKVREVLDAGDDVPPELSGLAGNRVGQMVPRVDAALDESL